MSDRDERGKDVTSRMSQRFETDEQEESSESSKPSEPDEPEQTDETSESDDGSVKDERVGTYMYLPESQKREMQRCYTVIKADYEYEYDDELEKNRHFYPLVAEYGLEGLEGLDSSEVRTRLQKNDWL